jgi:hypothetical protein
VKTARSSGRDDFVNDCVQNADVLVGLAAMALVATGDQLSSVYNVTLVQHSSNLSHPETFSHRGKIMFLLVAEDLPSGDAF